MKRSDPLAAGGLMGLLLVLWLGFLVHRDPRFAGSFWGGVLGVVGGLLMLIPLAYLVIKRLSWVNKRVTRHVTMRTLLTWHIYAGLLGAILALLHTGHKFESPLGSALTALMLIVVLSGFIGRYLLSHISQSVREKQEMLTRLETIYRETAGVTSVEPEPSFLNAVVPGNETVIHERPDTLLLSESMADLEYAIKTHQVFRRCFAGWLQLHILLSALLYGLLALHVWAGIHFGLRWFR